ncbi:YggT family protein [Alkanindiges sp. WGS2144]|uniref:YggT family protein n=1 Tax=Alkanindiges sp. WGS2144 TaxID=3366808 RepID=UPI003753427B
MEPLSSVLFNLVIDIATLLIFLRFIMQLAAVDYFNPVVQATVKATPVVDMFGRILPTVANGRLNLAALVLIVLLKLIDLMGNAYLHGQPTPAPVELLIATFLTLIQGLLRFCRYIIFGSIILSWVTAFTNARSPFIDVVWQLAEPLLAPFRRIMPNTGPLDFSPIIALLAIYIAEQLMRQATVTLLASIGSY